jgi:hypothetical protein
VLRDVIGLKRGIHMEKDVLLEVNNLKKYFDMGKGQLLKTVDDVSF